MFRESARTTSWCHEKSPLQPEEKFKENPEENEDKKDKMADPGVAKRSLWKYESLKAIHDLSRKLFVSPLQRFADILCLKN